MVLFIKFATFGLSIEVLFTAIVNNIGRLKAGQKIEWSLEGHSYIWMLPIYGSIAFIAPLVIVPLQGLFIFIRLFLFALIILLVEYVTGWILRKLTGKCPWHYKSGWHVHNLIRIDYIPLWMFFSWMVEWLYFNY